MKMKLWLCCLGWLAFALPCWSAQQPTAGSGNRLSVDFKQYKLGRLDGQPVGSGSNSWWEIGKSPDAQIVRPQDTSCGDRVLRIRRTASGGARIATTRPVDLERKGTITLSFDVNRGTEGGAIITLIRGTSAVAQGLGVYINSKGSVRANLSELDGDVTRQTLPGVLLEAGLWYRLELELRPTATPGEGKLDVYVSAAGRGQREKVLSGVPSQFHPGLYENLYVGPQSGELDLANIVITTTDQ